MEGLIVLVVFSITFAAIAVWAYLPRNKDKINALGNIPFKEDEHGR